LQNKDNAIETTCQILEIIFSKPFSSTYIRNMKINLICIGKTDDKEIKKLIDYYQLRLPKYWNFELVEILDCKNAKNLSPDLLKKEEAKLFLQQLDSKDLVVLLDEKGKQYTSREWANKIDFWQNNAYKKIAILIGGAYGFSDEIYQRAQEKIALSKMTFTHQMIRLFIVEQIYRADQILQGKPYHND
jgi:23S rRNA (pseudouridine1915-N3)-methyltransferase